MQDTLRVVMEVLFIIVIAGLLFTAGFIAGDAAAEQRMRGSAIENKCGQYNPTTSKFEWVKK